MRDKVGDVLTEKRRYGTAVVIGGSIGGSAAAAALAQHFQRVVVVERDVLPDGPELRKGAPHAHQYHVLTVGGRQALEDLLPGFTDGAIAAGALSVDPGLAINNGLKVGWLPKVTTGLQMLLGTRYFLEHQLRTRVSSISNVEYRSPLTVVGLTVEDNRATGVVVRNGRDASTTAQLSADLIVDASGRASRAPEWLAEVGFPAPRETTINARWAYTTTYFRPPSDWAPEWQGINLGPTVTGEGITATRGGAMWQQEDGKWVLTAQGVAGDNPPGDEAGMKDYLKSLGPTVFADIIDKVELVAPVVAWRNTANRMRDFAGMATRPEQFVAIGDSVAAYNPIYGQGMASAAFGARELRDSLTRFSQSASGDTLDGFAEEFQRRLQTEIIDDCWAFSTNSDYGVPGVEVDGVPLPKDEIPAGAEFAHRILALATVDEDVARLFVESVQLVRGVDWMSDEDIVQRVEADWDHLGSLVRVL
jgi:2-polyprenyl-6-methoxyphenol hydroxylase-like FAD-dependent oxidoreductase